MSGLRAAALWLAAATISTLITGAAQAASQPHATAAAPAGSQFTGMSPVRVLDTRDGTGTGGKIAQLGPGGQVSLDLSAEVPAGATAVVLNLTGVSPTADTYITANPDYGQSPYFTPVSNLNLVAGEIRSNAVTVAVGADRVVVLSNFHGNIDLVADLAGYYAPGSGAGYTPVTPTRVLDTRKTGSVGPGGLVVLDLSGQVPAGATAVTFNLTGLDATVGTYVTVWPDGQSAPTASSLNLVPGEVTPNLVTVALGANDKIDLSNFKGNVDLVADLAGYYATGTGDPYYSLAPTRVLDTRSASGASVNPLGPGGTRQVDLSRWLPAGTAAAVFNLTGTNTTAPTYVTAWPTGQDRPTASNLNLVAGQTAANLATVALGSGDQLYLYNFQGNTDLIMDLAGYFAPPATPCASNCAIAWGDNVFGELGNGTVSGSYNPVPAQVPGLSGVTAEAAGSGNVYALDSTGKVYAWGRNDYQQLGDASSGGEQAVPVQVSGLSGITAIAADDANGFALDSAHRLWAWGDNSAGGLGDGNTNASNVPVQVSLPAGVVSVSASYSTAHALLSDGTVWSWGNSQYAALGNGSTGNGNNPTPVQVSGLTGVTALYGNYAVKSDGSVWAWGWNAEGELGDGTSGGGNACYGDPALANCMAPAPVQVTALTGVTKIFPDPLGVSYATKPDGTVLAWGYNNLGQVGDGNVPTCGSTPADCYDSTPTAIANLTGFTGFATGDQFTVAVKSDGSVWAWGYTRNGQAGDQKQHDAPQQVSGISGATGVAAGVSGIALALVPNP